MKLDQALEEFGLLQRRRHTGEEGRLEAAALTALREFLVDYSGYTETEEISPRDLFNFLLDYYPAEEEPDPEVAATLLEASAGFSRWLVERGERTLAPFAAAEFSLRDDLPRVLEALSLLKEHAHREDPSGPAMLTDEEGEEELAEVATPYNRTVRLDTVDYGAAENEYYTVEQVAEDSVTLNSEERKALGEGAAGPVRVPPAAAKLLRAGDILQAEIAPGSSGWEVLDVFGIRPQGYA